MILDVKENHILGLNGYFGEYMECGVMISTGNSGCGLISTMMVITKRQKNLGDGLIVTLNKVLGLIINKKSMKKIKIGDPIIVEIFINKELEPYNVTMKDIMALPEGNIDGKPWYSHYTFNNEAEHDAWRNWCTEYLKTKVTPKLTKERINKEFAWFDLMYGLHTKK
jgi:hypothetical protein